MLNLSSMVPLSSRQVRWRWRRRQRRDWAPARKFQGLRGAARSPPLLHAPAAEERGWLAAPPHSGACGAGAYERSREDGRRRLRGAPRDPRGAWLEPAPLAPGRGALRRHGASRRRLADAQALGRGVRVLDLPRAAAGGGEHRGCMKLAKARAKGKGAAGPRSPSPPCAPRPAPSPAGPRVPGARCKFAKPPHGVGEKDASAEPPPGRIALLLRVRPPRQAQATRTHSLTRAGTATTRQPV